MQIKTKRLKGFTLIELIIVMAIFSMIMFGALAMILPVTNQFRNTVKFENVRANLDNVRLYIEGSLRYADRVHIYTGTEANDANINSAVSTFISNYKFNGDYSVVEGSDTKTYNRAVVDTSIADIEIYVMEIHNGGTTNKGKISLRTYDRTGVLKSDRDFAVNKAFYENYGFNINFGSPIDQQAYGEAGHGVIDIDDYVDKNGNPDPNGFLEYENFSPGNFAVTVEAEEFKNGTYSTTNFNSTATFALMNVWDGGVKRDLFYSKNITDSTDTEPKYNFKWFNPITNQIENKAPDAAAHSELRYKTFNNTGSENIFIVFTLPKQIS